MKVYMFLDGTYSLHFAWNFMIHKTILVSRAKFLRKGLRNLVY